MSTEIMKNLESFFARKAYNEFIGILENVFEYKSEDNFASFFLLANNNKKASRDVAASLIERVPKAAFLLSWICKNGNYFYLEETFKNFSRFGYINRETRQYTRFEIKNKHKGRSISEEYIMEKLRKESEYLFNIKKYLTSNK